MNETNTTILLDTTVDWPKLPVEINCYVPSTLETIHSFFSQCCLFLLFSLTSLFAFLGNAIVISVQVYGRESSANLRKYLLNLAVADIIVGVFSVPFSYTSVVLSHWIFPSWLCPVSQYFQLLGGFINAATLSIIGAERYLAALHPISRLCCWIQSHCRHLLLSAWLLGALYAAIPMPNTYTTEFDFEERTYLQCNYDNEISHLKRTLFPLVNLVFTFIFPLLAMAFFYLSIIHKLKKREKFIAVFTSTTVTQSKSSSEISKMLLTVLFLYIVSWMPVKVFQFLLNYSFISHCSEESFYPLLYIYITCHWLAMANSCVNPIIYSFMSKSFRNDFHRIFNRFGR